MLCNYTHDFVPADAIEDDLAWVPYYHGAKKKEECDGEQTADISLNCRSQLLLSTSNCCC